LAETAHFEPLSVTIGQAVSPGRRDKNTKKGSPERSGKKRGIGPAHALNPILTIFGMWGGPLDVFLKFQFRVGRSPNFAAMGGKKSPFSYSRPSLQSHTHSDIQLHVDSYTANQNIAYSAILRHYLCSYSLVELCTSNFVPFLYNYSPFF